VTRYTKGARGERELLNEFYMRKYSVMRSAGSGVNSISPDIIALKGGKGFAFECKAWDNTSLSIEPDKYEVLREWEKNTGLDTFIAWRMNGKGWFFIRLSELKLAEKNYTVTRKTAMEISRTLDTILNEGIVLNKDGIAVAEDSASAEGEAEVEIEVA
jgi:Holliday junction resolvase